MRGIGEKVSPPATLTFSLGDDSEAIEKIIDCKHLSYANVILQNLKNTTLVIFGIYVNR